MFVLELTGLMPSSPNLSSPISNKTRLNATGPFCQFEDPSYRVAIHQFVWNFALGHDYGAVFAPNSHRSHSTLVNSLESIFDLVKATFRREYSDQSIKTSCCSWARHLVAFAQTGIQWSSSKLSAQSSSSRSFEKTSYPWPRAQMYKARSASLPGQRARPGHVQRRIRPQKGDGEKKIAPTATKWLLVQFKWLLVQFFFTAPLPQIVRGPIPKSRSEKAVWSHEREQRFLYNKCED